jgi:hypothetical protein
MNANYRTDTAAHPPTLLRLLAAEALDGRDDEAAAALLSRRLKGQPHLADALAALMWNRMIGWLLADAKREQAMGSRREAGAGGQLSSAGNGLKTVSPGDEQDAPQGAATGAVVAEPQGQRTLAPVATDAPEGAGDGAGVPLPQGRESFAPSPQVPADEAGGAGQKSFAQQGLKARARSEERGGQSFAARQGRSGLAPAAPAPAGALHPNSLRGPTAEQRRAALVARTGTARALLDTVVHEIGRPLGDLGRAELAALAQRNGTRARLYQWLSGIVPDGSTVRECVAEADVLATVRMGCPVEPAVLIGG